MLRLGSSRRRRLPGDRSCEASSAPRIHAQLADVHGIHMGRKRLARPMRK